MPSHAHIISAGAQAIGRPWRGHQRATAATIATAQNTGCATTKSVAPISPYAPLALCSIRTWVHIEAATRPSPATPAPIPTHRSACPESESAGRRRPIHTRLHHRVAPCHLRSVEPEEHRPSDQDQRDCECRARPHEGFHIVVWLGTGLARPRNLPWSGKATRVQPGRFEPPALGLRSSQPLTKVNET